MNGELVEPVEAAESGLACVQASAPPSPRRSAFPLWVRWGLGLMVAALVTVGPFLYYRYSYTYAKRLREVAAGKFYRSGCMMAPGFREAIQRYGIRTVINLMEENKDPALHTSYFGSGTERESKLCKDCGVELIFLGVDTIDRDAPPGKRPAAIDKFLEIMDNPANHPVLLHCKAGLHRTGALAAVYRMEYDGWTPAQAMRELKKLGYGETNSTSDNIYIVQYILNFQPGMRFGRSKIAVSGQVSCLPADGNVCPTTSVSNSD